MTEILDCGHELVKVEGSLGTGYASDKAGKRYCYDCAAKPDKANIVEGKEVWAYTSTDGKKITTWAGVELMKITGHYEGRGGFTGHTHYYHAVSPDGRAYYGKNAGYFGGNGCSIRLKPRKS